MWRAPDILLVLPVLFVLAILLSVYVYLHFSGFFCFCFVSFYLINLLMLIYAIKCSHFRYTIWVLKTVYTYVTTTTIKIERLYPQRTSLITICSPLSSILGFRSLAFYNCRLGVCVSEFHTGEMGTACTYCVYSYCDWLILPSMFLGFILVISVVCSFSLLGIVSF